MHDRTPAAPSDILVRIRSAFPALHQRLPGNRPLVYLDNAASTLKPQAVVDRVATYYRLEHSNVHRGAHHLSQRATDAYEDARQTVARFINAAHEREIIFTRGTTEAINLVASGFEHGRLGEGHEVLITAMEHHSNMVPWQLACQRTGARLRVLPVTERGELETEALSKYLGERTRLVALTYVSNSLGTVNPVRRIIRAARALDVPVLLDGAQAAPHLQLDMQELDCDFFAFSGHKVFGPTGIGILYGKEALLDGLPPYQGGGDMIDTVTLETSTYADLPHKFEAGTPHIAGAIGLATALDMLSNIGLGAVEAHENDLLHYALERLSTVDQVRLVGEAQKRAGAVSFLLGDNNPYDVGRLLDEYGIAVRTGHHCTMPLMKLLGIPGTVRASFALYNTRDEVDVLVRSLEEVRDRLLKPKPLARTKPTKATLHKRHKTFVEDFDLFDDPNEKREFLMELGDSLQPFPDRWRTDAHLIRGCQSSVWLHTQFLNGRVHYHADSDAAITKGLVAVLTHLLEGETPDTILATNIDAYLAAIGLPDLITARRKTGLGAMIRRIRLDARVLAQSNDSR